MYTKTVPKEIKDMLKDIASKTDNSYQLIEDIYFSEFEFIAKSIESGESDNVPTFKNVLIKHLGSFISNERHILKLKEIKDAKKEKDKDCS